MGVKDPQRHGLGGAIGQDDVPAKHGNQLIQQDPAIDYLMPGLWFWESELLLGVHELVNASLFLDRTVEVGHSYIHALSLFFATATVFQWRQSC